MSVQLSGRSTREIVWASECPRFGRQEQGWCRAQHRGVDGILEEWRGFGTAAQRRWQDLPPGGPLHDAKTATWLELPRPVLCRKARDNLQFCYRGRALLV